MQQHMRNSIRLLIISIIICMSRAFIRNLYPKRSFINTYTLSLSIAKRSMSNKVDILRNILKREQVDAFIVPTDDPHMSEYTASYFGRREYISGFTGSAGVAIVTTNQSLLFTDGRYHRQAELELPSDWTLMKQGLKDVPTPNEYLATQLPAGSVVAIDPLVHSTQGVKALEAALKKSNISLKCLPFNPIDEVWGADRPGKPAGLVRVHPIEYSGKEVTTKLSELRDALAKKQSQHLIITALDEIMWLYNIRGSDVPFNPVSVSYGIVSPEAAYLFIDQEKLPINVQEHLTKNGVKVLPYEDMIPFVQQLTASAGGDQKVWIDPKTINEAIYRLIPESVRYEDESPIVLSKACKNEIELQGMIEAHIRDGAAEVEFLAWLEEQLHADKTVTEVEVDVELTAWRAKYAKFVECSFATIAGVNSNGAIIHYRAVPETCATLTKNDMLLLDSGGQYLDGTTDVTRTLHFGTPSTYQQEMFTRVLKGHIGLDRMIFPVGTPGCLLDTFARQHLWSIGKNYIHGTGHGVGAGLNVHEGPHRISPLLDGHGLFPGMVVSNEPGYYEVGNFGIRIENLIYVVKKPELGEFAGKEFLGFAKLTQIPIQKKLIVKDLLSSEEVEWINSYHKEVYEKVYPLLQTDRARQYLTEATSPL